MGIRLVVEVLDHAGELLTQTERLLLIALSEKADDTSRAVLWSRGEDPRATLRRRTGLSDRGLRDVLNRLAGRGLEVRVQRGVDGRGRPVFAYEGMATEFRIPDLRGGTVVPPLVDNPLQRRHESATTGQAEAALSCRTGGTLVPPVEPERRHESAAHVPPSLKSLAAREADDRAAVGEQDPSESHPDLGCTSTEGTSSADTAASPRPAAPGTNVSSSITTGGTRIGTQEDTSSADTAASPRPAAPTRPTSSADTAVVQRPAAPQPGTSSADTAAPPRPTAPTRPTSSADTAVVQRPAAPQPGTSSADTAAPPRPTPLQHAIEPDAGLVDTAAEGATREASNGPVAPPDRARGGPDEFDPESPPSSGFDSAQSPPESGFVGSGRDGKGREAATPPRGATPTSPRSTLATPAPEKTEPQPVVVDEAQTRAITALLQRLEPSIDQAEAQACVAAVVARKAPDDVARYVGSFSADDVARWAGTTRRRPPGRGRPTRARCATGALIAADGSCCEDCAGQIHERRAPGDVGDAHLGELARPRGVA